MLFLTFDTSLDKTYISLFNDSTELAAEIIENHDDKYHSAFLIQNLVNLLKKYKFMMSDVNAIGVNVGPGSFTGIRACLTIARVIAQQLEIPLVGVPSLEILARLNNSGLPSIVIMDARKGMCYFAEYSKDGKQLQAPQLVPLETLNISDTTHKIISDKVMQEFLREKSIESTCYTDLQVNLGELLGKITLEKLNQGETPHWAEVKPLYLQKPSITISKKTLL